MKKLIVFMTMLLLVTGFTSIYADEKPRIGVLRFTNSTNAGWWNSTVGRDLQDMLASELVSTKKFQVLERSELDAVLDEQDLSASGRVSKSTLAKMGKIKGAAFLVAGTVSAYERDVSGTGGGISFKGVSVGGKKEKCYVAVDIKVIDTETGEIVDARTIEAKAKGSALGAGVNVGDFRVGGDTYKKTAAGKAIRGCVVYISEYLECSMIKGQDHKCMKKWDKMDEKRREKTKDSIELD
jgi:curli biogenesis system outer membrane secretion channel CsgG